jgi:hypothetical protein
MTEMTIYLSARDRLAETKQQGQVAVNVMVPFKLARGLNTLPGGCNLDEHTVLGNTLVGVELDELHGFGLGSLLVEGQARIDLGRDTARYDLEDLGAERYELRTN